MIKRLMSKRSGFTLVEIVVAFAVFAIMSTMIVQILNMISLQRISNNEFARSVDEQEEYLVTKPKKSYNTPDGDISITFTGSGADTVFDVSYQMFGTNDDGSVDGLAYFVSEVKEGSGDGGAGGEGGAGGGGNNTGSQAERVNLRISGTKGFEYIAVNEVINLGQDADGNYVYYFDLSADGRYMNWDDIPYSMYRLYFYKNGTSNSTVDIVKAYYADTGVTAGNVTGYTEVSTGVGSSTGGQKYMVSLAGTFGIRIGSPFTSGAGGGSDQPTTYVCSQCGTMYANSWDGWSNCPNKTSDWDPCNPHLVPYVEPRDPNAPYTGNGVQFRDDPDSHTRVAIVFKEDPQITAASFGSNGTPNGSGYIYRPNADLTDEVNTGSNIYGAYPK
ncbi:MAG: prepilin-type N-terminal cleavage/methylation domain-containing protein [Oscillospiraceae bacterium]|nr:prepilin-type N-terminal cleavage/methylation domain-containing protein [Oscillospiraceae bacterium]